MSKVVVRVEQLAKKYQLGTIGYGSLRADLATAWARLRGKEDPNSELGTEGRKSLRSDFWALRDINFEVNQGDRIGIIGRNGAGKSTLLKILSRITAPTLGSVKIVGKVASLLEVGTGFHGELSGRENVFLNGAILGMRRREIQEKFDEIVDFAGVSEFIDTPVKRYSSGMYVRLGFSVAAHLDSDILVVDEVLAVGDVEFQKKCLGKMEDISRGQGRTVLFVSHAMTSIRQLCSTALYLKAGTKVMQEETGKVVEEYLRDTLVLSKVDFDKVTPNFDAKVVKFRSFVLENSHSDQLYVISQSEKARFRVEFSLSENVDDFKLTLSVSTIDGVLLVATISSIAGQKQNLEKGDHSAVLEIAFPFAAGSYSLHFGADRRNENLWWINNLSQLEITSDLYDPNQKAILSIPYQWSFEGR